MRGHCPQLPWINYFDSMLKWHSTIFLHAQRLFMMTFQNISKLELLDHQIKQITYVKIIFFPSSLMLSLYLYVWFMPIQTKKLSFWYIYLFGLFYKDTIIDWWLNFSLRTKPNFAWISRLRTKFFYKWTIGQLRLHRLFY